MALTNMKVELRRFGITQKSVAKHLGMSENNLNMKLNEKVPMTVDEAREINNEFLPNVNLDYLLESDGVKPSTEESLHAQAEAIGDAFRHSGINEEDANDVEELFHEVADAYERQPN